MTSWQPIEAAPKDGSYIIAGRFGPSLELKWVKHSRWITAEEIADGWSEPEEFNASWTDGDDIDEPIYPTHWMPLEPPEADNHG